MIQKEPPAEWTCLFVSQMHRARLSIADLSRETGMNRSFISRELSSSHPTENFRKRVIEAYRSIMDRKYVEKRRQDELKGD